MKLDKQNMLSENQNLAVAVGTHYSENSIDLGVAGTPANGGVALHDLGRGNEKEIIAQVTEAFTSAGAATMEIQLITGTGVDANGKINAGQKVVARTGVLGKAEFTLGKKFYLDVPPGIDQRYLGLAFVVGAFDMTAGKVTGGLVAGRETAPGLN